MKNVMLQHLKSQNVTRITPISFILSGICLIIVWILIICSFAARSDLITTGQIYLQQGNDILFQIKNGIFFENKKGIAEYETLVEKEILPAQYISTFIENGGTIIMQDSISNDNYLKDLTDIGAERLGTYERDENRITIKNGASASTYIHELGHYVDEHYGVLSSTEDFHKIADVYRKKYIIYKNLTDDVCISIYCENFLYNEMFAEMFTDTHIAPSTMRHLFPEVYEYMKDLETIEM